MKRLICIVLCMMLISIIPVYADEIGKTECENDYQEVMEIYEAIERYFPGIVEKPSRESLHAYSDRCIDCKEQLADLRVVHEYSAIDQDGCKQTLLELNNGGYIITGIYDSTGTSGLTNNSSNVYTMYWYYWGYGSLYYRVDAKLRRIFDTSTGLFMFDSPSVLDVTLTNITYYTYYRYGSYLNNMVFRGNLIYGNDYGSYDTLFGVELTGYVNANSGAVFVSHNCGVPY